MDVVMNQAMKIYRTAFDNANLIIFKTKI